MIHNKKIFLLNTAGFYNHLIAHMNTMAKEGFLYGDLEEKVTILTEPSQFISYFDAE